MLKISSVSKSYAKSEVKAVTNVSLEIKEGEIFGFIGPNGAGKSTTIKMLTGILGFEEGSIEICGKNIKTQRVEAQKNIGYVPDTNDVYQNLTGSEYVNFVADIYQVPEALRKERIEKFAKMFNLESDLNRPIKSYSRGMQQKITIISALVHNPRLWVLDEPFTGLDPQAVIYLKELMREHCANGNSVFFSSHVLDVVEKLCDKIAIINKGSIAAFGTVDEIRRKTGMSLEDFFLQVVGGHKSKEDLPSNSSVENMKKESEKSQGTLGEVGDKNERV